ncbi:MAG: zinc ribbon domain-containing protein [Candidatus Heimdallarchaeaceae archaeon]
MSETEPCPYCFREIKKGVNFCKYCGSAIKYCPECNSANKAESLFCSSCGKDIRDIIVKKRETEPPISHRVVDPTASQKIVMWPPPGQFFPTQPKYRPYQTPEEQLFGTADKQESFQPKIIYPYSKVAILGFLRGPISTSKVFSSVIEAFAYGLSLIAAGVLIISLSFLFLQTLILPIIGLLWGGTLILSAPFFGMYFVSSNWLYKAFKIKKPVSDMTILWNYLFSIIFFSFISLILLPLLATNTLFATIFGIIALIVIFAVLIVIPLKAFLIDLAYVKAAVMERESQKDKEETSDEDKTQNDKEEVEETKKEANKIEKKES